MAHEMTDTDTMFSVREVPWHGLGIVLDDNPDPALVLQAAGLDWKVVEDEIYRKLVREGDLGTTFPKLPGWKMLTRSDTGDILHVAKDSYAVVQNETGAEIMGLLLGADSAVKYETGGSIRGGAVCYLTARIDEPFVVDGDDSLSFPFCVVTWAHDGSGAVEARATTVRVVCGNTVSASEAESRRTGRHFTFRHTKNVHAKIEDAKDALAGVREETKAFQVLANELAAIPVTDEQREEFVRTFIPEPSSTYVVSDRVLDNITRDRNKVRSLFDGETIPEAHTNTAYGMVLAGTEYLDHLRAYRNADTYLNRTLLREEPLKKKLVPMVRELVKV